MLASPDITDYFPKLLKEFTLRTMESQRRVIYNASSQKEQTYLHILQNFLHTHSYLKEQSD